MLSLLSEESVKLFETQTSDAKAKTITVLATFANITKCMLDKQEFRSKICHDTQILCEQVRVLSNLSHRSIYHFPVIFIESV